jgi:acetyl-CoA carboxylase biotin carboxyl carrier protein
MSVDREGLIRVLEAYEQEEWDEIDLVAPGIELHLMVGEAGPLSKETFRMPVADRAARSELHGAVSPDLALSASSSDSQSLTGNHSVAVQGELVVEIISPTPGIFWRSPQPGAPPFVEEGARVEVDAILCIVEIMKLMHSVPAHRPGVVVGILPSNGEEVERGQVLFRIRLEGV